MACKTCWGLGVRHIQLFLVACGFAVSLIFRICPMMAIRLAKQEQQESSSYHEDPFKNTIITWQDPDILPLDYCLYYGYPIGTFIGGVMSVRLNPKYTLLASTLFMSLASFAVPSVLRSRTENVSYYAIVVIRVVIGTLQGLNESLSFQILGRWASVVDYCKASVLLPIGNLSGYMVIHGAMYFIGKNVMGWATVFYTSGNIGILWCVAWATFGSNDFRSCFYISAEERLFMASSTQDLDSFGMSGRSKKRPYRWKLLFARKSSKDLYVLIITCLMIDWAQSNIMVPRFVEDYFGGGYEAKASEFWKSRGIFFVYITALLIICMVGARVADHVVNVKRVAGCHQRKTCNSVGLWGQAIVFVLSGFNTSETSKDAARLMAFIAFMLAPFVFMGVGVSYLTMAPNYAGFIYGIVKGISSLPLALYLARMALLTKNDAVQMMTREEYRQIAFSAAGVFFMANFLYVSLFDCDVQEWNKADLSWTKSLSVQYS